jgi:hypothetical protein
VLLVLVFISTAYASSLAQTDMKSEFVSLKTGDGLTLTGDIGCSSGKVGADF